jgi:chromosome segregation protein
MRLKRLELFGFKSFADRTVLEFPEKFTGIVGPNGCGKSNVVDAMRWVLGETRPTSMRGGEMTDVIFKGSTSRAPMGLAEVTLVLDNSAGDIPLHGSEVSVTRRVHKSGEGEYEIDGNRVRLKDVRDLLFDTGLGSRGYAVLEQGKIDAVLSANPQDRRSIFEEAAGVSRFRQRRKETESRLKRVDQDMEQIDSVLRELRSQERSLKIQAGKAERWVAARDLWRQRGVSAAQHQLHSGESRLGELAAALAEQRASIEERRARRENGEALVAAERARVDAAALEAERLADEAARAAAELSGARERREALLAHRDAALRTANDEARRAEDLAQRSVERAAEIAAADLEVAALVERAAGLTADLEGAQAAAREAERIYREARDKSRSLNDRVTHCLQERTAAIADHKHAENAVAPALERLTRARQAEGEAEQRRTDAQRHVVEAGHAFESAELELAEAQARADAVRGELEALVRRTAAAQDERRKLEVERAGLESRIQALLDREREWESLEDGARALLERKARGDAALPNLRGLLADHLRVPTRYARALDAALGSAGVGIVVDGADPAQAIGRWLKDGRLGRARLVFPEPLNPGRCEPGEPEVPYSLRARVIGCLIDQVDVAPGYADVARVLLCDCLLVEDLDAAVALAEFLPGWRFATPEGDLVDAAGVTTGHQEVGHGAVGRRSEAQELATRARLLSERLDVLKAEIAVLEGERVRYEEDAKAARARASAASASHAECKSRRHHALERQREAEHAVGERARNAIERQRDHERALARLAEATAERDRAQAAFDEENAKLSGAEAERAELEERRMSAESRTQGARVALAQLEADQRAAVRRVQALRDNLAELEREEARSRGLAQRHAADAERNTQAAAELEVRTVELVAREADLAERARAAREEERALRAALESQRREIDGLTEGLERDAAVVSTLALEEQRLALSRDELLRRCAEDFQLERDFLVEGFVPEPELADPERLAALVAEVAELKRQLDRLGPVNLEAVQQLEEVSQRLGFLEAQHKDLAESKAELERTLATINSESEKLFVETFEEIRGHFREIFRQLFGGGRADILLEEGQPVLEAGIEIVARPPGREQLPIGLLSGGQRTMTALALLFAVFQSRPSPFCVLDEVDAALDDANVGRFLGMLDGFVDETQFIVVTHNKGTMAASDMLYGITMETKGVSCRVAVELSDVDKFVPEATGDAAKAAAARSQAEPVVELIPAPAKVTRRPRGAAARAGAEGLDGEFLVEDDEPRRAAAAAEAALAALPESEVTDTTDANSALDADASAEPVDSAGLGAERND